MNGFEELPLIAACYLDSAAAIYLLILTVQRNDKTLQIRSHIFTNTYMENEKNKKQRFQAVI